jgi:hypothetical protein
MFGKAVLLDMINRSTETTADRRAFLRGMGLVGLGVAGAGVAGAALAPAASADAATDAATDAAVLNFALNLEYLEAEFYSYAAFGHGLTPSLTTGSGTRGGVDGGHKVLFKDRSTRQYAEEIAHDEIAHVKFLRGALGAAGIQPVARPAINFTDAFQGAAVAAGVASADAPFDPFADDVSFLLGAFVFEDVGVTAYKGAAPLITNKAYLEAAAGILGVEAYHAGIVRSALYELGTDVQAVANKISAARDSLDGSTDDDQGITDGSDANIVPTGADGIAFSRSPQQVLNVVYLKAGAGVTKGGFYPNGVNGGIATT